MATKQVFFYLTTTDLIELLSELSMEIDFEAIRTGLHEEEGYLRYDVKSDVNFLKEVPSGDWNLNNSFLLIPRGLKIEVRKVEQRSGGFKFAIDQMKNMDSLVLSVGGEYDSKFIIGGKLASLGDTPFVRKAFSVARKLLKKKFDCVDGWFVSKGLDRKYILTTNVKRISG